MHQNVQYPSWTGGTGGTDGTGGERQLLEILSFGRHFGNLIVEFCILAFSFKASKAPCGIKRRNMTHLEHSKLALVNKRFSLVNTTAQMCGNKFQNTGY